MNNTATRWLLLIQGRFDTMTRVTFEDAQPASVAWEQARRKMTLEELDMVTEVLAVPIDEMRKVLL